MITKKTALYLFIPACSGMSLHAATLDENTEEVIEVKAYQTHTNKKLNKYAQIGSLGEKDIQNTPFSITSYSNEGIRNQNASTLGDVLKNDPSIRTSTGSHHFNENFLLRGLPLNYEDISYNNFYGMAPFGHTPIEFIESVTVLKGPNTLIGGVAPSGGAVGGVLILNPKRADYEVTRFTSSLDDGKYFQNHLDISRFLDDEQKLGVRANMVHGNGEHYIKGMHDRKSLGSLAIDYQGDDFHLSLDAYSIYEKRKNGTPTIINMNTKTGVLTPPDGDTNYFNNSNTESKSKFIGLNTEYFVNPDIKLYGNVGYAEKEANGFLNGTRLTVINDKGDAKGNLFNLGYSEHNLSSRLGSEFKFNTGYFSHVMNIRGDYLQRKTNEHKKPNLSDSFNTNIYNPSSSPEMPGKPQLNKNLDNQYLSYNIADTVSVLDEKLQVTMGIRYQEMNIRNYLTGNGKKATYRKASPNIGLVIKPFSNDLSFYANYMEGLSDGFSVSFPNDVNYGKSFEPQTTKQYEVGAKLATDNWYSTLALFQITKPGTMVTQLSTPTKENKTQITTSDAKNKIQGIEFVASGYITKDLSLLNQTSIMKAKYEKAAMNEGKYMPGIPKFTTATELEYNVPQLRNLYISARGTYVGKQELSADNSLQLPEYKTLDLGVRYNIKTNKINTTIFAKVDNVTNEKYWEGVFGGANWATIGSSRNYKVGFSVEF
ncbi:TPA: TonB-dependent siderophore receptor [Raoultella ornithinolytica]|nr:TonB-dependent siderophore receptor [Raoultella ornithinolytica]